MNNIVLLGDEGRMPAPSGEYGEWVLGHLPELAFIRALRQESGVRRVEWLVLCRGGHEFPESYVPLPAVQWPRNELSSGPLSVRAALCPEDLCCTLFVCKGISLSFMSSTFHWRRHF